MSVAAGMDTKEMDSFAKVTINNLVLALHGLLYNQHVVYRTNILLKVSVTRPLEKPFNQSINQSTFNYRG